HFLHFRLEVVRSRLKFELEALKRRIHIPEGFETVFDALDEILKIVRKSDGKADDAEKVMARFALDAEQTDAILELKIYCLAALAVVPGSTRATVVFFTNFGVAYTSKIADIPASTGYGEPIQSLFKFKDGEKVVAGISLDPRVSGKITSAKAEVAPPTHALAV